MLGPGRPVHEAAGPVRTVTLPTAKDTHEFGRRLAAVLRRGDLVILDGPLGAGKTALTQGIGAGLDVAGAVVSPTFVIARVHPPKQDAGITLVHVDAYRLGSLAEVDDLDLDVDAAGVVTVIEWGAGIAEQLAESHLTISLSRTVRPDTQSDSDSDSDERTAVLYPEGGDWAERLAAVR